MRGSNFDPAYHEHSKNILKRLNESLEYEKRRLETQSLKSYRRKLQVGNVQENDITVERNIGTPERALSSNGVSPSHTSPKLRYLHQSSKRGENPGSQMPGGLPWRDDPLASDSLANDHLLHSRSGGHVEEERRLGGSSGRHGEGRVEGTELFLKENVWDEDFEWQQALKEVQAEMREALIQKEKEERERQIEKYISGELAKLEKTLKKKYQAEIDRMKHSLEHAFEHSATKSIVELQNELHYSSRGQEEDLQKKWKEELKAALEELEETSVEITRREEEIVRDEENLYRTEALSALQDRLEHETNELLKEEQAHLTRQVQDKREQLEKALQEQVSASLSSLEMALDEDQKRQAQQLRDQTNQQLEEALENKFGHGMAQTENRLEKSISQAQHGYFSLLREMDASLKAVSALALLPKHLVEERLAEERDSGNAAGAPLPLRKAARIYQVLIESYELNSEKLGSLARQVLKMRQQQSSDLSSMMASRDEKVNFIEPNGSSLNYNSRRNQTNRRKPHQLSFLGSF